MKQILAFSICYGLVPIALSLAGDSKAGSPMGQMPISVWDISGVKSLRPVTGGIPLAQGSASEGANFALHDENDDSVPLQTSVLARWKDRSARWVLLDFQAEPAPNATAHFKLSWGKKLKAVNPQFPVEVNRQDRPSIRTRTVVVSPVGDALLRISDRVDLGLTMTNSKGKKCTAIVRIVGCANRG